MSVGNGTGAPGGGGGSPGADGADGKDAFTVTIATFDWGNANETAYFQVATGTVSWMRVGQWLNISDDTYAGFRKVTAIGAEDPEAPGYQLVESMDLNTTGNPWNQVLAIGATVCPSGRPA